MIINLTQHLATLDQIQAGVVDLPPSERIALVAALTANSLPTRQDIVERCNKIMDIAKRNDATHAMIGGAGWIISRLEAALITNDIIPMHAFSVRDSFEVMCSDGSVRKENVFRHIGFV